MPYYHNKKFFESRLLENAFVNDLYYSLHISYATITLCSEIYDLQHNTVNLNTISLANMT